MCVFVVICEVKRMQIMFYTNLSGTIFSIASCNYTASLGPRLLWWQLAYGSPQLVIFANSAEISVIVGHISCILERSEQQTKQTNRLYLS